MGLRRSDINPMPEYFDRYINLVDDVELIEAFDRSIVEIESLDLELLRRIGDTVYAPGKWTINTVIQHITDFERVFCYRALVHARQLGMKTEGIDEDLMADNSKTLGRDQGDVLEELRLARLASRSMFKTFDDETLLTTGLMWKSELSVLAMGFNLIGHQIHHFNVLRERYFPIAG